MTISNNRKLRTRSIKYSIIMTLINSLSDFDREVFFIKAKEVYDSKAELQKALVDSSASKSKHNQKIEKLEKSLKFHEDHFTNYDRH